MSEKKRRFLRGQRGEDLKMLAVCLMALAAAAALTLMDNTRLIVSRYWIEAGLRRPMVIVQVSDLHGACFGENQARLAETIRREGPEAIVITGDIIDRNKGGLESAEAAVRALSALAPTYYITGNHERDLMDWDSAFEAALFERLEAAGAVVLNGQSAALAEGVTLTGLPQLTRGLGGAARYADYLETLPPPSGAFNILLAHQPEFAADYAAAGYDLALCGHAHGGQVRLPLIGGLYSSGQGFFPEYSKGLYDVEQMTMAVSCGLGNSGPTFRINNPPEIVVVILT